MRTPALPNTALPRGFYVFGIFISGVYTAMIAFQNYIIGLGGGRVLMQSFSVDWLTLFVLLQVAVSLVMLRYYHDQKFWLPFSVGAVVIVASLWQYVIVFSQIPTRAPNQFYLPAAVAVLGANTLHGVSLVFTKAGKRPFLKATGAVTTLLGGIFLLNLICNLNSADAQLKITLGKVHTWAAWAVLLLPVLFGVNLYGELKRLNEKAADAPLQVSSLRLLAHVPLAAVAVIALVFSIRLEQKVREESIQTSFVSEVEKARAERFEAGIFVNKAGDTLRYRLMKPMNYDSRQKYPLVVCLHQRGAHGKDNVRQIEGSDAPWLAHYLNREKYPAFLFVPQSPFDLDWTNPTMEALVMQTIQALETEFPIDGNRRYVMGSSGGGYGTWHLLATYPTMFAAGIPRCGVGDPRLAPNLKNVPVWAFHGEYDSVVSVSGSRDMIEAIKRAGGPPRYTEFAGVGHDTGRKFENTPGVLDWLFAQKRDSLAAVPN